MAHVVLDAGGAVAAVFAVPQPGISREIPDDAPSLAAFAAAQAALPAAAAAGVPAATPDPSPARLAALEALLQQRGVVTAADLAALPK